MRTVVSRLCRLNMGAMQSCPRAALDGHVMCGVFIETHRLLLALTPSRPTMDPDPPTRRRAALERQGLLNPGANALRDPLFADRDFFDPDDIVQVRYEMLRAGRVGERSVAETAAAFGVSRATYYQALAAFSEEGITGLIPEKRGPRGAHKLTDEVVDFVVSEWVEHPGMDSQAMAEAVADRFGVRVHPRSVERAFARRGKKNRTRRG